MIEKPEDKTNSFEQWTAVSQINKKREIDTGSRISVAITDQFIMTFVCMIFVAPVMILEFTTNKLPNTSGGLWYLALAGFSIYFCKDCINGQSPAKRLFKQQVINNKTDLPANALRCFVRDVFIIIWPIEVIVLLINPSRRVGDFIAGTKVVPFNEAREKLPVNYLQIAIAYILSYAIWFLVGKIF